MDRRPSPARHAPAQHAAAHDAPAHDAAGAAVPVTVPDPDPVTSQRASANGTSGRPPAWLLALIVLPWILRGLGERTALLDGFYAHAALMLARGHQPYVDFTQVAFPLAEGLLAGAIALLGPSLWLIGWLNRLVGLAVALGLYGVGRRLGGPRAGALAALLYAWSTWTIGFDLFERETWAALGSVLALRAYLAAPRLGRADCWKVAAALLLAVAIKITAVLVAFGICAHLLLQARRRELFGLGLRFAGLVLALSAGCAAVWGLPFFWQVYVFGFFRNQTHDVAEALVFVVEHADPTLLLGLIGLVHIGLPQLRRPAGVLACVLLGDLAYATLISPVIWDHNLINLVPSCALLGALSLTDAWRAREALRLRALGACVAAGAFALPLVYAEHFDWRPWEYDFGFGLGQRRSEVAERVAFLRRHSQRDEIVACLQPWEAFAADRVKFVRYWDLQPVARGVEDSLLGDGLGATWGRRGVETLLVGAGDPAPDPRMQAFISPYERRLYACAWHWVRPELLDGLARREIALVLEPLPPVLLLPEDLRAAGYERFEDGDLAGWRPPARRAAAVRALYSD